MQWRNELRANRLLTLLVNTFVLENTFVPVTGAGQRVENALDLVLSPGFEGYVDESVAQADTVIGAVKLQFDNVGVVSSNDPRELMERAGAQAAHVALVEFREAERWTVVYGGGANGGDGRIMAEHLESAGKKVKLVDAKAGGIRLR